MIRCDSASEPFKLDGDLDQSRILLEQKMLLTFLEGYLHIKADVVHSASTDVAKSACQILNFFVAKLPFMLHNCGRNLFKTMIQRHDFKLLKQAVVDICIVGKCDNLFSSSKFCPAKF